MLLSFSEEVDLARGVEHEYTLVHSTLHFVHLLFLEIVRLLTVLHLLSQVVRLRQE